MLTEQEVARVWRTLFTQQPVGEETFTRAENLLDELRGESPLRHRLSIELEELRAKAAPAKAPKARRKKVAST